MLRQVGVGERRLDDYRPYVEDEMLAEIRQISGQLRGARVVHVNATSFGGGVAEILFSLVPLMRDLGLDAEWQVIEGTEEFFQVTKAMHNGLQGMEIDFTPAMQEIWRRYNEQNAAAFEGSYDFAIIHDPQPAGLARLASPARVQHWIWRCHIDTSHPLPAFWEFCAPYVRAYEAGIFTLAEYVGPGLALRHLAIIPPTIDPLAPKNRDISSEEAARVVARFGIDPSRPLLVQVSRFDPWKDPLGVIDAYRLVQRDHPGVQLALVGSMAADDPEGWTYLDRTLRHAGEDPDLFIFHNFHGVNAYEVGCFQASSDVVIQKSTREGFGLVVSEALWKGKPVVGGDVGGIPLQIVEGETGYLVHDVAGCARRCSELLGDPHARARLGRSGREHVRKNFLTPRYLRDYLRLFRDLVTPARRAAG